MTREQLEHAIRAACDVSGDDEVIIFGSQAILGTFPDAPEALRYSVEVDVTPRHRVEQIDAIDGALGELSRFYQTFGFYVHGVSIEAAKLPKGWQGRLVPVRTPGTNGKAGLCLERHDLAASKLAAFREKDRDFVRVLLVENLIEPRKLIARIRTLPLAEEERERRVKWVDLTAREAQAR